MSTSTSLPEPIHSMCHPQMELDENDLTPVKDEELPSSTQTAAASILTATHFSPLIPPLTALIMVAGKAAAAEGSAAAAAAAEGSAAAAAAAAGITLGGQSSFSDASLPIKTPILPSSSSSSATTITISHDEGPHHAYSSLPPRPTLPPPSMGSYSLPPKSQQNLFGVTTAHPSSSSPPTANVVTSPTLASILSSPHSAVGLPLQPCKANPFEVEKFPADSVEPNSCISPVWTPQTMHHASLLAALGNAVRHPSAYHQTKHANASASLPHHLQIPVPSLLNASSSLVHGEIGSSASGGTSSFWSASEPSHSAYHAPLSSSGGGAQSPFNRLNLSDPAKPSPPGVQELAVDYLMGHGPHSTSANSPHHSRRPMSATVVQSQSPTSAGPMPTFNFSHHSSDPILPNLQHQANHGSPSLPNMLRQQSSPYPRSSGSSPTETANYHRAAYVGADGKSYPSPHSLDRSASAASASSNTSSIDVRISAFDSPRRSRNAHINYSELDQADSAELFAPMRRTSSLPGAQARLPTPAKRMRDIDYYYEGRKLEDIGSVPPPRLASSLAVPGRKRSGAERRCINCDTTDSPLWRKTEDKLHYHCNACGIYLKQHGIQRPLEMNLNSDGKPKQRRTFKKKKKNAPTPFAQNLPTYFPPPVSSAPIAALLNDDSDSGAVSICAVSCASNPSTDVVSPPLPIPRPFPMPYHYSP